MLSSLDTSGIDLKHYEIMKVMQLKNDTSRILPHWDDGRRGLRSIGSRRIQARCGKLMTCPQF